MCLLDWTKLPVLNCRLDPLGMPQNPVVVVMHMSSFTRNHTVCNGYIYIFAVLPHKQKALLCCKDITEFDFRRAVHRNIISVVKPTRCTNVSNLFILERHSTCFGRKDRLKHVECLYKINKFASKLASRQQYLFDKCLLLYVQSWTLDDGRKDRPKHVECLSKINKFDTLVHLVGFTIGITLHNISIRRVDIKVEELIRL